MCIGIPMQIIEQREFSALCRGRNGEKVIDTLLVGNQPEGSWILEFHGSARQVISAQEAKQIGDALELVDALQRGESSLDVDAFFPDLANPARRPGRLLED